MITFELIIWRKFSITWRVLIKGNGYGRGISHNRGIDCFLYTRLRIGYARVGQVMREWTRVCAGRPGICAGGKGYARVDSGYARVDSGYARVDSGYARVGPGYARVDSGYARVDQGMRG
ncbi:hypothetical protein HNO89_002325 [Sporosarcina luteola]|nr:hypothetical protein [Sporosarcina luteola]